MRYFSPLFMMFVLINAGCIQERPFTEVEKNREYVISHAKTKVDAYNAAEIWIAETFVSAKAVIDVRQPDAGLIIGKGQIFTPNDQPNTFLSSLPPTEFGITLKIINGEKKTVLRTSTDFTGFAQGRASITEKTLGELFNKIDFLANSLAKSLGGELTTRPPVYVAPPEPERAPARGLF